jgi:multicomponent K+:H+ antiporter subunit E
MKRPFARLLPAPLSSAVIFVSWLLLNNTLDPAHLLLAALLALVLPLALRRLRPDVPRVRRWAPVPRLVAVVLWDIVISSIDLARRVLGPQSRLRPTFVEVPLALTDAHGIAVLASIITMTPGTLTADLSAAQDRLLVHVFHADDPQAVVDSIKQRYEQPLLEIFG